MPRRSVVTLLVVAGSVVVLLFVNGFGRRSVLPAATVESVVQGAESTEPQAALSVPATPTSSSAKEREAQQNFDASFAPVARVGRPTSAEAQEEATIELQVVIAESGEPFDGVEVRFADQNHEMGGIGDSTDADGRWERACSPGDYVLRVGGGWRRDRGANFSLIDTEIERVEVDGLGPGEHRRLAVALHTVHDLLHHVRLVDSVTAEGIPQAWIDLFDPQLPSLADVDEGCTRVVCDGEGRATCWIPSWRVVPVRIGSPDHAPRFTFLSTGSTTPDEPEILTLDPWPTLEVAMIDERARPIAPIRAQAVEEETHFAALGIDPDGPAWPPDLLLHGRSHITESDRDGVVRFERLPPGVPVHLTIARDLVFDRHIAVPITLAAGETRRVTYGYLELSLRGVVRDANGRPLAEVPVWLLPAEGAQAPGATRAFADDEAASARTTRTDRGGFFSFADMTPGWWWVGPAPSGDPPQHPFATIGDAVEVRADSRTTEIALTVRAGG